ncbi:MAG: hypothetical protein J0M02_11735 [Planctomycetes bacterium]|nr:hypothetical protein [Planctomycetota bacterium]
MSLAWIMADVATDPACALMVMMPPMCVPEFVQVTLAGIPEKETVAPDGAPTKV